MNHKLNFNYRLPYNEELLELKLKPYRTNKQLESKINYLFSHVTFEHRELYNNVSTSGTRSLNRDMSNIAVACMRHFVDNKQQYASNIENIEWQILVRMWRQTFKHCKLQEFKLDKYYGTKAKLLNIQNQWVDELLRTVLDKDYIQHSDDMVKKRTNVELRDRISYGTHEGGTNFEYICRLAENEISSLISDDTSLD